ncbi:MAG: PhnD/SsuA/transferrin family substrate-binding protein [Emcibacteraceae bacterium]|nr:PhnD/SsuA/transferrin family substrate-binding protein [Emcibacteraceae bacterium]
MVTNFRPILNHLEQRLSEHFSQDVHIRLQVFSTYKKGVEAIASGEVDFTQLGPASYVFAKIAEPALQIIAMENQNGQKIFKGVICIRADSSITSIKDLKGKSFAFGNPRSTIGRYLSQNHMMSEGIYASDLKEYDYLGRHDTVGTAVNAGDYDAGALKEGTFKKLIAKGAKLKKLVEFNNVTKPWVARKGLDGNLIDAIREALLNLTTVEILQGISKQGFLLGDDNDYEETRRAISLNKYFYIVRDESRKKENKND